MTEHNKKDRHNEAFALMWYACSTCGHRERIWNSRDGVTSFGTACPSCGNPNLIHVDWQLDERKPDHVLHPRQKYWRDGTIDEAVGAVVRRIVKFVKQGRPPPAEIEAALLKEARDQTGEWRPGWPHLAINLGLKDATVQ